MATFIFSWMVYFPGKYAQKYPFGWDYFETQMMICANHCLTWCWVVFNYFYDLFVADMLWYILFVGG